MKKNKMNFDTVRNIYLMKINKLTWFKYAIGKIFKKTYEFMKHSVRNIYLKEINMVQVYNGKFDANQIADILLILF